MAHGERIAVVETRIMTLIEQHREATAERREAFEKLERQVAALRDEVLALFQKQREENTAQHQATDQRLEALERPFQTAGTIRDVLRVQWKTAATLAAIIGTIYGSWSGAFARLGAWLATFR